MDKNREVFVRYVVDMNSLVELDKLPYKLRFGAALKYWLAKNYGDKFRNVQKNSADLQHRKKLIKIKAMLWKQVNAEFTDNNVEQLVLCIDREFKDDAQDIVDSFSGYVCEIMERNKDIAYLLEEPLHYMISRRELL